MKYSEYSTYCVYRTLGNIGKQKYSRTDPICNREYSTQDELEDIFELLRFPRLLREFVYRICCPFVRRAYKDVHLNFHEINNSGDRNLRLYR